MELVAWLISFVLHIDRHLFDLVSNYGAWVYALLFLIVFCETGLVVTPFLPGDSLLFACGVLAGAGLTSYPKTVGVLLAAGILGDFVNYKIGRRVGPAIFKQDTRFIKKAHLVKAHAFYERHGGKAIVLARFIPIIRTFAPFVAGIAVMNPATFLLFNVTGCVIWVASLVSAGYFLGNTPFAREHFSLIVYAIILVSIMPIVVELIKGWWKQRKNT
ncbi:MAG: DedA family protein [Deltaproteobacteria bacterium]|jgi:membrane-associated protein|nr:DedA family protein [Deltaproteobacteria bacterium]